MLTALHKISPQVFVSRADAHPDPLPGAEADVARERAGSQLARR